MSIKIGESHPTLKVLLRVFCWHFLLHFKEFGRGPQIIHGENDAQVKSHDSVDNSSETQEEPH